MTILWEFLKKKTSQVLWGEALSNASAGRAIRPGTGARLNAPEFART
jgi:hypothetical protein